MSASKRGLKYIDDDLTHENYNPVIDEGPDGRGLPRPDGYDFLFKPFNMNPDTSKSYVSITVGLWTFIATILACLLFALVFLLVLESETTTPTDLSPLIVTLVAAILTVGPMMWTFDTDLRIHTVPGIVLAGLGTLDYGLIPTIALLVAQFGGYALGGLIAKAIVPSVILIDQSTGTSGYVMAWLATSIMIFQYIYNNKYEFHREYEVDNHTRAANWLGLWRVAFGLGFWKLGLRTFNSGLFLAAGIFSNTFDNTPSPADTVADGLFYTLVPLLASAATAYGLYLLASVFIRFKNQTFAVYTQKFRFRNTRPDYTQVDKKVSSRYGASARKRTLDATF